MVVRNIISSTSSFDYRLDQSVKRTQKSTREEKVFVNSKGDGGAVELNNLVATSPLEVEEVPTLIHQTEVSWDATLDPVSYFKIGQVMEAKVHQLDFTLERIFLSLKEITLDPLIEILESVVGGRDPLDGRLQAAQAGTEVIVCTLSRILFQVPYEEEPNLVVITKSCRLGSPLAADIW